MSPGTYVVIPVPPKFVGITPPIIVEKSFHSGNPFSTDNIWLLFPTCITDKELVEVDDIFEFAYIISPTIYELIPVPPCNGNNLGTHLISLFNTDNI